MSEFRVLALPPPAVLKGETQRDGNSREPHLHLAMCVGERFVPLDAVFTLLMRLNGLAAECFMESIDRVSCLRVILGAVGRLLSIFTFHFIFVSIV